LEFSNQIKNEELTSWSNDFLTKNQDLEIDKIYEMIEELNKRLSI